MAYIGIALCFIPLIFSFILFLFAFKIKASKMMLVILLGLIAVFPISVIQFFLPSLPILQTQPVLKALLRSIFLYGLVEELIKTGLFIPLTRKEQEPLNYLLLAFTMGLTVACFESSVYYLDHLQIASAKGAELLYGQIFLRIVTSDIIHLTCTGLCGLFIFSCKNKPVKINVLLIAVLIHGFYDFFAGFQNNLKFFAIPVILLGIIECRIIYSNAQNLCENRLTVFY